MNSIVMVIIVIFELSNIKQRKIKQDTKRFLNCTSEKDELGLLVSESKMNCLFSMLLSVLRFTLT